MFHKLQIGSEIVYESNNLPNPRLIGYKEFERVLTALGYNVMRRDAERDSRLKNMDFLVDSTCDHLYARNRGWGLRIEVNEARVRSDDGWQIKITGKNRNDVEKIAKALEEEIYSEAKKLIDTKSISEKHYHEILKEYGIE
ncbi:Uncharacterised protein [uncultured archaeon]|nr:Uncharacterised protein [uncultured archaeon]